MAKNIVELKIEVENGGLVLKEVFSGILLETEEGNQIGICMRDDTFEINVIPKGSKERNWHHVDMQTASIQKDAPRPESSSDGLTDKERNWHHVNMQTASIKKEKEGLKSSDGTWIKWEDIWHWWQNERKERRW